MLIPMQSMDVIFLSQIKFRPGLKTPNESIHIGLVQITYNVILLSIVCLFMWGLENVIMGALAQCKKTQIKLEFTLGWGISWSYSQGPHERTHTA